MTKKSTTPHRIVINTPNGWTWVRALEPIPVDEQCLCIDETCPNCGWPERITPLPGNGAGELFGCRKCNHVSRERNR